MFPENEGKILPRAIHATNSGIYTVITDGSISRFDLQTGELHHLLYQSGAIAYASDGEFIYVLKAGKQGSRGRSTPGMLKIYNTSGIIVGEQQADDQGVLEDMFVKGDFLYAVDNRKLYSLFLNPYPAFTTEDIPFGIVGPTLAVMLLVQRKIKNGSY
ncbi:MAG: hypothetical protein D6694_05980 [Gammaproteobacteria bacterium]|nr:MAG: hypothetical protein D6694_05980 [Gammaproteobacteria bacterium]